MDKKKLEAERKKLIVKTNSEKVQEFRNGMRDFVLKYPDTISDTEAKEIIQSCLTFAASVAVIQPQILTHDEFIEMAEVEWERLRRAAELFAGKDSAES